MLLPVLLCIILSSTPPPFYSFIVEFQQNTLRTRICKIIYSGFHIQTFPFIMSQLFHIYYLFFFFLPRFFLGFSSFSLCFRCLRTGLSCIFFSSCLFSSSSRAIFSTSSSMFRASAISL